jgi:hypothetical protein
MIAAMSINANTQEAVMGQAIPRQHPAVVLRSHYTRLRALLAVMLVAVVGLSTAVVVIAIDDDGQQTSASSASAVSAPGPAGSRYDGGPEEGTRGLSAQPPSVRFDGGPEEGTRGAQFSSSAPSSTRPDGGPEEGTRGPGR